MTDPPSSRVSSVVSMLGDFNAFCASFLTLGDVIAAGALAIIQFYVAGIGNTSPQLSNPAKESHCGEGRGNMQLNGYRSSHFPSLSQDLM